MTIPTPILQHLIDAAADAVRREVCKRTLLNPHCQYDEVWASITHDGHLFIGTPVLRNGQGYYVDYRGKWVEV